MATDLLSSIVTSAPHFTPLALRLDRTNFNYWKIQVLAAVKAHGFDGILLGTEAAPSQFLQSASSSSNSTPTNPAYLLWVHCGFMQGGGEEMAPKDIEYVKKCKFVVATGIFDAYDSPHQPSNISKRSESLFCFLMVVDEVSLKFIRNNVSVTEDIHGGQWVGIWRLILLKHQPYDEPRRNGKVPKILTHRYLWRGKYTFAIAQHKHHRNIYEEADSNKRRKRYARPLIDLHMKIYRYEGLEPWSQQKAP
ncbi:hypothetical protein DH2020_014279 [Rehmannia glutinosa]|uniref:TOD1/MUCI70 glycosyltransferase-like domain-containing protein n=1 Tax=Rehmannia glutinosa TaxID=99300 RepID=A0ABR0WWU3_REHGL